MEDGDPQGAGDATGATRAACDIATEFAKDPWAGYHIAGICTPLGPTHPKEVLTVNVGRAQGVRKGDEPLVAHCRIADYTRARDPVLRAASRRRLSSG